MKKLISVVLAFALITCGVVYYTNENNAYAVSASSNENQLLARAVNGEARGIQLRIRVPHSEPAKWKEFPLKPSMLNS